MTTIYVLLACLFSMGLLTWRFSSRLLDVERRCVDAERDRDMFYFELERLEASNNAMRVALRDPNGRVLRHAAENAHPVDTISDYRGLASGASYKMGDS